MDHGAGYCGIRYPRAGARGHGFTTNSETILMTDDYCGATKRDGSGETCELPAGWGTDHDDGPCKYHGGATRDDSGAPEGNTNAATVGAWADGFFEGFLTEEEQRRVTEMADALDDQRTAKELGQHVATLALEQFRRTGDERFLRRFESICDKFSIAPAEEIDVSETVTLDSNLSDEEKEMLSDAFDVDPQPDDDS